MDDELNVPVKFKGNKRIFLSHVPTSTKLNTCQHFDMTSHNEWNTDSINILDLSKTYQLSKKYTRYIYQTKQDNVYT